MAKTIYICQSCGYSTHRWIGKCIACGSWDSIVEEQVVKNNDSIVSSTPVSIKSLSDSSITPTSRFLTGIDELDLVFGGGIVKGSSTLIGGEPGVGKSTLLLKVASTLASDSSECLYVSGEETG